MISLAVLAVITNTDDVRTCALSFAAGDPAANDSVTRGSSVLVGTSGGLVHGSAVITASDGLPGTRIDAIQIDGDHAWLGTDGGVAEIELATDKIVKSVATKPVRDIATFGGKRYLATWDGGVVVAGDSLPMAGGNKAARERVSSLAVADGVLYAGTAAGLYALSHGKLVRVDDTPAEVASLAGDGDTLWLGTPQGLVQRRGGAFHALGGGDVRRVAILDGRVVLAGDGGLQTVDRGRVVALPGAPKLGIALAIAGDGKRACAGGLDGLWTEDGDAWTHAPVRGGLPANDIAALAADGDTLWVGTFDHGLAKYRGGWHAIAGVDQRIDAIVVAPDAIWVGTAEGVTQIDRDGHVLATFTRHDGLPGRSALALARLHDGRIAVGSSSGAALIDCGSGEARCDRGKVSRVGPHDSGNVWAIAEADDGSLWIGATTGLYHGAAIAWSAKDERETWERHSVATNELRDDWVTAISVTKDAVYAGTYKGGVTKIDPSGATQLGGGWINPAGLAWDGARLLASTMDGLVALDGTTWNAISHLPGRDTTAVARVGRTMWVSTRRGLASL